MTLWVRNDRFTVSARCPLLLRERPNRCVALGDATGYRSLFDDLIGGIQQAKRHGEAECLGGLEIDQQLELGRTVDR
jgi:hypothetical protein